MRCFQCHNKFFSGGILISADGDFVCSEKCKATYEKEKSLFFSEIVHSEEKTEAWLMGYNG